MSRASSSAFIEEMPSRRPIESIVLTSDDPPAEISGSVTPVSGKSFVLPPTISIVCNPSSTTSPNAVSEWKLVRAFIATIRPRSTMMAYTASTHTAKISPNSSAMEAKMKSEWYSGMLVGLPSPSPMPNSPPEPMAISACTS